MSQLLIHNKHNQTVNIPDGISRVVVLNCSNINIEPMGECIKINGRGEGDQRPLFLIAGSNDIWVAPLELIGDVDGTSKDSWLATVPNGLEVRPDCNSVTLARVDGINLHYAVLGRCAGFKLLSGCVRYVSGDFVRLNGDGFELRDFAGLYSLEVLPYEQLHRDCVQVYQDDDSKTESGLRVLSNGTIKNCRFWTPETGHKWAKSADGLMFTDGIYRNIHIEGNRIYTNNKNGLRADVMIDYEITPDNIFDSADAVTEADFE